MANLKSPKNGYAYVYLSNESNEPVYFDNFVVGDNRGRIIEEDHYYSYGLKIAAISSKKLPDANEGNIDNKNLYNDKELFDEGDLNWYDYGFRNYDAQIGRFIQLDPLTDGYPHYTPYQYAGNEPIANIDRDGLEEFNIVTQKTSGVLKVTGSSSFTFIKAAAPSAASHAGSVIGQAAIAGLNIAANVILHSRPVTDGITNGLRSFRPLNLTDTKMLTAEEANLQAGLSQNPWKANTRVPQYRTSTSQKFVRVFDNNTSPKRSDWMMKESDIEGLTPEEIQQKYALPSKPVFRTDVKVPSGTLMQRGYAGENAFGKGGGQQFRVLERIPEENFTNLRFLPEITPSLPPPSVQYEEVPFFEDPIFEDPIFENPIKI